MNLNDLLARYETKPTDEGISRWLLQAVSARFSKNDYRRDGPRPLDWVWRRGDRVIAIAPTTSYARNEIAKHIEIHDVASLAPWSRRCSSSPEA